MNRILTCCLMCFCLLSVKAQTQPASQGTSPYGKVDMADLQMTSCDFEKDANAEILFDKGTTKERHTRIKIFNEFGKRYANVRLVFPGTTPIRGIQGETFNIERGQVQITPLDNNQIYFEKIDRFHSAMVFSLPNVKAGSIIEYKYNGNYEYTWYFQSYLPTRYSEVQTDFGTQISFRYIPYISQPLVIDKGENTDYVQRKAMANIHSLPDESYMGSRWDNLQRMEYVGRPAFFNTWEKIGDILLKSDDVGNEFDRMVSGGKAIVNKANTFKSNDEKIAFIFDTVKNHMRWNKITTFIKTDGTVRAWNKESGNSAEINLIVYQLLKKANIKAYPFFVSSKGNKKISPINPNPFLLNNLVVYVPVDSTKSYVLDATNKYNLYNTIPEDELNSFGLSIDESNKEYKTIFIENPEPATNLVFLNAEIKPGGKIEGSAEITSYSYHKKNAVEKYKTDGEEKYLDYLRNKNNNIKISSIKFTEMNIDSLPLVQKFNFNAGLDGSDEQYIYFGANWFTGLTANPFMNEERYSNIDFGYRSNCAISGVYKLPSGYKIEALPKSTTIVMPDQSIVFKRIVAEDNGVVLVKYNLNHKKTIYFKENYEYIRGFYKKMYEMLNEQVVLKKI